MAENGLVGEPWRRPVSVDILRININYLYIKKRKKNTFIRIDIDSAVAAMKSGWPDWLAG